MYRVTCFSCLLFEFLFQFLSKANMHRINNNDTAAPRRQITLKYELICVFKVKLSLLLRMSMCLFFFFFSIGNRTTESSVKVLFVRISLHIFVQFSSQCVKQYPTILFILPIDIDNRCCLCSHFTVQLSYYMYCKGISIAQGKVEICL